MAKYSRITGLMGLFLKVTVAFRPFDLICYRRTKR
jgi:hypothetical protein